MLLRKKKESLYFDFSTKMFTVKIIEQKKFEQKKFIVLSLF